MCKHHSWLSLSVNDEEKKVLYNSLHFYSRTSHFRPLPTSGQQWRDVFRCFEEMRRCERGENEMNAKSVSPSWWRSCDETQTYSIIDSSYYCFFLSHLSLHLFCFSPFTLIVSLCLLFFLFFLSFLRFYFSNYLTSFLSSFSVSLFPFLFLVSLFPLSVSPLSSSLSPSVLFSPKIFLLSLSCQRKENISFLKTKIFSAFGFSFTKPIRIILRSNFQKWCLEWKSWPIAQRSLSKRGAASLRKSVRILSDVCWIPALNCCQNCQIKKFKLKRYVDTQLLNP